MCSYKLPVPRGSNYRLTKWLVLFRVNFYCVKEIEAFVATSIDKEITMITIPDAKNRRNIAMNYMSKIFRVWSTNVIYFAMAL